MRSVLAFLVLLAVPSAANEAIDIGSDDALGPGESITEFFVRGTGRNDAGFFELYSGRVWDEADCFFVRIPTAARGEFESAGIRDIARHFMGHRIRVRGRVGVLHFGNSAHPCVTVDDPAKIRRLDDVRNFMPSAAYRQRIIEGFTILMAPELLRHDLETAACIGEVESQLRAIAGAVQPDRLAILGRSRIWIEWQANPDGAAAHHTSGQWLERNGFNPDKAGDVEINNVRNFVGWSRGAQPWMLMHELAHAYHARKRREVGDAIESAYRQAMSRGIYDEVKHANGKHERAYAAKNPEEYFAEVTEAYFGRNDFMPFDRGGLREFDPAGYQLMLGVWGPPLN